MQASALVSELEPVAGRLLDRHLASAREWFPHELIPYERGRAARPGAWTEADADLGGASLPEAVRSSLYVNLLTEDNLPYYLRDIHILFGGDDAFASEILADDTGIELLIARLEEIDEEITWDA